jgi:hypothetical protein
MTEKKEAVRLQCTLCHNQVGHPFPNPRSKVDAAIAAGKISRDLPGVMARAVAMINATTEVSGPLAERTAAIDKAIAENAAKANVPDKLKEKEAQFQKAMKEILLTSTFEDKGTTWKSFPNHAQHLDTPGCFRCHDGKHFNDKGEAIRLQCTLCHNLPQARLEDGRGSVPSTIVAGVTPPDSHEAPNWMHEHRFNLDDSCSMCHGKIEFGRDGGNFCANPACHGRQWPGVNLNAEWKSPTAAAPKAAPAAAAAPADKKAEKKADKK